MQKFLPNDIIRQNKKGFNVPIGKWLNKEFKTLVLDVLSEK